MDQRDCAEALEQIVLPLQALGVSLGGIQRRLLVRYCSLLLAANRQINLTAIRTPEGVMRTLVLDSLTLVLGLPPDLLVSKTQPAPAVVDVGSGAGVPGIPLKILFPHWSLALVESIAKKARFLQAAVDDLGLADTTVVQGRAEALGAGACRDTADLCLARAVSRLASLLELCAPMTAVGGFLAFPKSGDVDAEIGHARLAERALKVTLRDVVPVPQELGLGSERVIVLYQKTAPTPPGYPRRPGLATSRPIGTQRAPRGGTPRGREEQRRSGKHPPPAGQ